MKTQRELNLHYWSAIHEMVEAYNNEHSANVYPCTCVRSASSKRPYESHPQFSEDSIYYEFAVAILYDEQAGVHRPIFENDRLYLFGEEAIAEKFGVKSLEGVCYYGYGAEYFERNVSWDKPKPKRTFEINGVELPCPVENQGHVIRIQCISSDPVSTSYFRFESEADATKVEHAIVKLLEEARDKEAV